MSRVIEQYRQACQYLAGGVSSSTRVNSAGPRHALRPRPRAAGCGTSTARNTSTSVAATGRRCWATATRAFAGPSTRRSTAAPPAPTRTSCTPSWPSLLCETVPCLRARPLHRLRHRGDDALPAPGPRLHGQHEDPQVRGQLSRLPRSGDVRHRHARRPTGAGERPDRLSPARPACRPGSNSNLVVVPYNRPDLFEEAFRRHAHELAAVICEPIYYNAGCIIPSPEFLHAASAN